MSRKQSRRLPLPLAIGAYTLCAALAGGLVVGNAYASTYSDLISVYLDQPTQKVVSAEGTDAEYFTSDFTSDEDRQAYLAEVGTRISEEGITLLGNDGSLPLTSGARISVFGQDAVDPVYGGGGAGSVDASKAVDLGQSLADAGFEVNPTLWDFYADGAGAEYRKTTPDVYGQGEFAVNEVPQSAYTPEVTASYADYADAAVVVLGRSGGESGDLAMTPDADGSTYLQLTQDERDLLDAVTDEFDTVVLVLNTQNPVELGFLDEYPIGATLWVGAFGQTGAAAVGEVLSGAVNPSGALVDTYAYDSLSAPSAANLGSYAITNSEVAMGASYMVYAEGVYVGYRYYETRYEDAVLGATGTGDFDYAAQVQFPFGFGGSYTTFDWSDYAVTEGDDAFEVAVTVTNSGEVAGKDVVQVYLQQPYTDYDREHGVEKPAVELAGYAKQTAAEWADPYSTAMLERAAQQCAEWVRKYGIPIRHLTVAELKAGRMGFVAHDDVSKAFKRSTHWDPGPNFPWASFLARVAALVSGAVPVVNPVPAPTPSTVIRKGSTGSLVSRVQTFLGITADGIFGPATHAAVVAYQRALGLTVDGIVGAQTWEAINAGRRAADGPSTRSTTQSRATQAAVHATQDGYWGDDTDNGVNIVRAALNGQRDRQAQVTVGAPPDGIWGPKSQAALVATVKKLQAAWGVTADGVWGPKTEAAYQAARARNYKTW